MNKHTIITIIAIIVIVSPFLYAAWNIYAVEKLQFQWNDSEFSFFDMSNQGSFKVCNPLPFFVSANGYTIIPMFDEKPLGMYQTEYFAVNPQSYEIVNGEFSSESFSEAQYYFLHMDGEFSGTIPIRIDPTKMTVETQIQTSLLGVIPNTITKQYSGFEFFNLMKDKENFDC